MDLDLNNDNDEETNESEGTETEKEEVTESITSPTKEVNELIFII